jgi:hypothetical protein
MLELKSDEDVIFIGSRPDHGPAIWDYEMIKITLLWDMSNKNHILFV